MNDIQRQWNHAWQHNPRLQAEVRNAAEREKDEHAALRRQYAMHAPGVPNWFRMEGEGHPPGIPSVHGLNEAHKRQVERILSGDLAPEGADPAVQSFWRKFEEARHEKDEWQRKMQEKKYFLWRFYYADMMIEAERKDGAA